MAHILCRNKGHEHYHESVFQSKICYGLVDDISHAIVSEPVEDRVTPRQLKYIVDLGGDEAKVATMTKHEASSYIDELKRKPAEPVVTAPTPPVMPYKAKLEDDPKVKMVLGLIDLVPNGYYAAQMEEGAKIYFLRLSRPKSGRFAGAIKVQTIHGETLKEAFVVWPSRRVSKYTNDPHFIDHLLLLMTNSRSAARLYSKEIGRCCRCNMRLTDDRSRHYGIGPICDGIWTWIIDEVDEENDGHSFEWLRSRGLV